MLFTCDLAKIHKQKPTVGYTNINKTIDIYLIKILEYLNKLTNFLAALMRI